MPDPMGGFTSLPAEGGLQRVRVPCKVKIVNRSEYQHMDRGPAANWACEKRPPDRIPFSKSSVRIVRTCPI